jgi:hypothetical protein
MAGSRYRVDEQIKNFRRLEEVVSPAVSGQAAGSKLKARPQSAQLAFLIVRERMHAFFMERHRILHQQAGKALDAILNRVLMLFGALTFLSLD